MDYINAVIMLCLAGITFYYAVQTRKTVKEMQKTRKFEFLPIISIRLWHTSYNLVTVVIMNIGKGIAQNPKLYIPSQINPYLFQNLAPEQDKAEEVNLQPSTILQLPEDDRKIKVECLDIFNRKIVSEGLIEAKDPKNIGGSELVLKNWNLIFPEN